MCSSSSTQIYNVFILFALETIKHSLRNEILLFLFAYLREALAGISHEINVYGSYLMRRVCHRDYKTRGKFKFVRG